MQVWLTVVDPTTRRWANVVVHADADSPVHEVATALDATVRVPGGGEAPAGVEGEERRPSVASRRRRRPRHGSEQPRAAAQLFVSGHTVDPDAALARSGLCDGAVVSLDDASGCLPAEPDGLVEIRVVSGPGSGVVHRLPLGEVTIGSDVSCVVPLEDRTCPPVALTLAVASDATVTVDPVPGPEGAVPVRLDGEEVVGPFTWRPTQSVRVGELLLELDAPTAPDAALRAGDDGPAPTSSPRAGRRGWPGRWRPCATSPTATPTPRSRTHAGCWTSSALNHRPPTPSRRDGWWTGGRPGRSFAFCVCDLFWMGRPVRISLRRAFVLVPSPIRSGGRVRASCCPRCAGVSSVDHCPVGRVAGEGG